MSKVSNSLKISASAIAISVALAAMPAKAADILNNVPVANWAGTYMGFHVGVTEQEARFEDEGFDWYGSTHEYYSDGLNYGLQIGKNWQKGSFVYGLSADITGFTNSDRTLFAQDDIVENDLNWMATVRARAGLGVGNSLLYYTAGIAVADFDRSWIEFADPSDSWPDLGDTKLGFIGGIGLERMISDDWSWYVEGTIAKFGDNDTINGDRFEMGTDDTVMSLMIGLNYRMGGGAEVAAASVSEGTPYDFSGTYAGIGAGYHTGFIGASDIDYNYYGSTYEHNFDGLTASVFLGHNWQNGAQVHGVEAELAWLGGDGDFTANFGNGTWNNNFDWAGAVKYRSGIAAGDTLMYLLGGIAFANYETSFNFAPMSIDGTEFGLIAGAGIEHAIMPNMTARVEATYTEWLGDTQAITGGGSFYRANAADLALRGSVSWFIDGRDRAQGGGVIAPAANWAGMYAGFDVMALSHTSSIFDRTYSEHGGSYNVPSIGGGAGIHVGYNWQDESYVTGIVADFAFLTNDEDDTSTGYRQIRSSVDWTASIRARAGIATGNSLLYLTGGVALADIESAHDEGPGDRFAVDGTRAGWVAGLGVEHKVSEQGSWRLEALYTDFGEESSVNGVTCNDGFGAAPCSMEHYDSNVTVKFGYSHKFN